MERFDRPPCVEPNRHLKSLLQPVAALYHPAMPAGLPVSDSGRINPVNLVTATRLLRVPTQRLGFLLSKLPEWLARPFDELSLERQLKTLNFLHTTRWVDVGRFPRVTRDLRRERFGIRWVLYTGNFDGQWEPYFGAFMEAMGEGVYDVWGQSVDYPKFPAPRTANALEDWLVTRIPPSQHYYVAYPHVTTNDIRCALRVRREVCSLAVELATRHGGACSTEVVTRAFDEITARVRHCLQPIDFPAWRQPPTLADGSIGGIVAIFPLRPGHEPFLRQAIEQLPSGQSAAPSGTSRAPTLLAWRCSIATRSVVTPRRW